ncbi:MAG: sigma-70 family RNA polymerase sigma factor [Verrucomicrobia bacterium]|nr:sigma-70 family RNA polymerase sigma factor [Verrucomicrobiota bacterium]
MASAQCFLTTHWSVVVAAREGASVEADAALERLCSIYWWPLYAFVRRRGYYAHDAQDLTQEFFARLLAKDFLHEVDRSKGKFRSFLLAALEHFLAKEWRRANAQKRGGKFTFVSLNDGSAETQFLQVPSSDLPPEKLFEQQWALTLLTQVTTRLQQEQVAAGKGGQFEKLKIFLTGEKRAVAYADLALQLNTTEAALKMAVNRLRQRYRELLRAEIAQTVAGPEEVEEELRAVVSALS